MPTLTFKKKYLKAVQNGTKTQTQRTSHTLHTTKVGAPAVLQFGKRDALTTLRTTITRVEVLDYLAFADRLAETGDPRGDMSPEEFHTAIRESGTAEERRMLEVAEANGQTVEEVCAQLADETQEAVEAYAEKERLSPARMSDAEVDALYAKFHRRVVVLHFAKP
ncbi:hypothetical protein [Deinococcus sp. Marseille-Q6407]|uniref:hypothetical protein n=1 Tax=Deinococcus sp. Marseille-Q6407 TaxID=2969223 RepID=UPI0021C1466A|nr:hypothetical protein [Deinococcus sp. Marseille-Q6407]